MNSCKSSCTFFYIVEMMRRLILKYQTPLLTSLSHLRSKLFSQLLLSTSGYVGSHTRKMYSRGFEVFCLEKLTQCAYKQGLLPLCAPALLLLLTHWDFLKLGLICSKFLSGLSAASMVRLKLKKSLGIKLDTLFRCIQHIIRTKNIITSHQ